MELYREKKNVLLNVWGTDVALWSQHLNLVTRSVVISSEIGKLLTIPEPQFTLLENGYATYLLGIHGTEVAKDFQLSNHYEFQFLK